MKTFLADFYNKSIWMLHVSAGLLGICFFLSELANGPPNLHHPPTSLASAMQQNYLLVSLFTGILCVFASRLKYPIIYFVSTLVVGFLFLLSDAVLIV